jgi:hypothetical protein
MAFSVDRLDAGDLQLTMGFDFLPEDAWQVHELVERTLAGSRVVLDFRRVRHCADFALSLLARDILSSRVSVDLQGLTQHQERVLSYFGVASTAPEGAAADFDPI